VTKIILPPPDAAVGQVDSGMVSAPTASASSVPWTRGLGTGIVTGAAGDDPSGIATYSQTGARFGFGLLWTAVLTVPLMIAIQSVCARIGRVTGHGLASNMALVLPRPVLLGLVGVLLTANIFNLAADISAMGSTLHTVVGGSAFAWAAAIVVLSVTLEVCVPFRRYSPVLKILTLTLLTYVITVFIIPVPWMDVLRGLWASVRPTRDEFLMVLAIFGTTISPYLFFWQPAEEIEEEDDQALPPLLDDEPGAIAALRKISIDTSVGMVLSNLVALAIMITAAVVLRPHGIVDIQTADQAAQALAPLAGRASGLLFALGIIGTGLLAIPVLAGSAAYAATECAGRRASLAATPSQAPLFYTVITVATVVGAGLTLLPIAPMRFLVWSAVANGILAVPLMVGIMIVASSRRVMGHFAVRGWIRAGGWVATTIMAIVAVEALWPA
jgi:Mn2+/Fe2+ NRAMP family transporter